MSGIFGFINLDGRPASPESFQKMADEMAGWGPDGVGSILSGNAAFGHALLVVTHESRFEKMPLCDQDEGILFTAAARLDNRDELCDLFGISHPERPVTSDGQLVLRAYKKWGSESCKHIFGDWSFAAWNIKEQRLFLARDHLGNTGQYYYFKPPLLVFASNPMAVLAHPQVPRELNELYLAQRIDWWNYSEKIWSQTYWMYIFSLPVSHSITFKVTKHLIDEYWRLNESSPVCYKSDNEYVDAFLEHFRRAVRVRLNSIRPICTQLSAGIDSSSVTALAAEALRERHQKLIAYTATPIYPAENLFPKNICNEWPLAHKVADLYENIEHIAIQAEDITPLTAIKRSLKINFMPQHAAANLFWIISIFENAKRRNIGVMLTGQLGNGGISWRGGKNYIFYLFARNQWNKGFLALNAWKKQRGFSFIKALKSQLLRPVLLPLWYKSQRFLRSETQKEAYSFLYKDFFNQKKSNYSKDAYLVFSEKLDPLTERVMATMNSSSMVGSIWHSFGMFYNIEIRDPTADVRLLEYCMGIPEEQYAFEGRERMLIRRAMAGILPDAVRWNTIRGKQAADIVDRLIHHCEEMDQEIALLAASPVVTKYLSVEVIKCAWHRIKMKDTCKTEVNINDFLRTLYVGVFLNSFYKDQL